MPFLVSIDSTACVLETAVAVDKTADGKLR